MHTSASSAVVVQRAVAIEELFPAGAVAFEALDVPSSVLSLFPAERACVAHAADKRVREFAAGRLCARAGLEALGADPVPILMGPDRRPLWPRGIVGSISHTAGYCVAVLGRGTQFAAIGVDVERVANVHASVLDLVLRPEELTQLAGLDESDRLRMATVMFSAKEAFFKCQYELTRSWLEFEDVSVKVTANASLEISVVGKGAAPATFLGSWRGSVCFDASCVASGISLPGCPAPDGMG